MPAPETTSRLLSDVAGPYLHRSSLPNGNRNLAHSRNPGKVEPLTAPIPDALAPFHLASNDERTRRTRDVLKWAHDIYRRGGISMVNAISDAVSGGPGDPAGEYAKQILRRILLELNLVAWEEHPNRTRRDVHALFRKAIGRLTPHLGGWKVSR